MSYAEFEQRASGILLHLTSLPGPHGHGDLGPAAKQLVDLLAQSGQRWWQILPIVPTGSGNSPYESVSSFAGGPHLISLEHLARAGWLRPDELVAPRSFVETRARYEPAARFRVRRLRMAYARYAATARRRNALSEHAERHALWLPDYALFRALQRAHDGAAWTQWEPGLARRRPLALERARRELAEETQYQLFLQYQFDRQWTQLRGYCKRRGVLLLGDVPMYVAHNSADVWSHPELFDLHRDGNPRRVAGVPPDAFSRTGQLWGNPLYRWDRLQETDYRWWVDRLRQNLNRFDAVRLDHFIGFSRCYSIAASARTAREGRFVPGPGSGFLTALRSAIGGLPFVAEDLGLLTPEVHALRDRFELPGMRVLQFAFDDEGGRLYQPHRYPPLSLAYTGTHDNDTIVGWFGRLPHRDRPRERRQALARRERALRYAGSDGHDLHFDLIRLVLASPANLALLPLQDLLGLGSSARMNVPGTATGNWEWRVTQTQLERTPFGRLAEMCSDYERTAPARVRRRA